MFVKGSSDVIRFIRHGCKRHFISQSVFNDKAIYWQVDNLITTVQSFSNLQEPAERTEEYIQAVLSKFGLYTQFREQLLNFIGVKEKGGDVVFISGNFLLH